MSSEDLSNGDDLEISNQSLLAVQSKSPSLPETPSSSKPSDDSHAEDKSKKNASKSSAGSSKDLHDDDYVTIGFLKTYVMDIISDKLGNEGLEANKNIKEVHYFKTNIWILQKTCNSNIVLYRFINQILLQDLDTYCASENLQDDQLVTFKDLKKVLALEKVSSSLGRKNSDVRMTNKNKVVISSQKLDN